MCMASDLSIKFFGFDSDELLKTLEPFFLKRFYQFQEQYSLDSEHVYEGFNWLM